MRKTLERALRGSSLVEVLVPELPDSSDEEIPESAVFVDGKEAVLRVTVGRKQLGARCVPLQKISVKALKALEEPED